MQREADDTSGAAGRLLAIRAERQLEIAEPFAARAAGDNANWDALQANLQEVQSLPTKMLIPALRADCTAL